MSSLNPIIGASFVHNDARKPEADHILKRFSLAGKTAIISGAGGGIGYAVATAYAQVGANIAIWYHSNKKAPERAAALAKEYNVKSKSKFQMIGCLVVPNIWSQQSLHTRSMFEMRDRLKRLLTRVSRT